VDLHTAGNLKKTVTDMLEEKNGSIGLWVMDWNTLTVLDLSVFIGAIKKLQKKPPHHCHQIKPSIKKLLNITGLDKIIVVEN
jgi:anti-sigma B factor antagonist